MCNGAGMVNTVIQSIPEVVYYEFYYLDVLGGNVVVEVDDEAAVASEAAGRGTTAPLGGTPPTGRW